jgi:hypothetical protein
MSSRAYSPLLSIVLFILAALFGAVGQFLYKSGAERTTDSPMSYVANPALLEQTKVSGTVVFEERRS